MVKVSAGGFSTVVGHLQFVQRGYDLTATLALLPIICIVAACLLTLILICMRKRRSCSVKPKLKTPVDISYVQVAPSSDIVSSMSHWPLRQQPSPLLSRQYNSCLYHLHVHSVVYLTTVFNEFCICTILCGRCDGTDQEVDLVRNGWAVSRRLF